MATPWSSAYWTLRLPVQKLRSHSTLSRTAYRQLSRRQQQTLRNFHPRRHASGVADSTPSTSIPHHTPPPPPSPPRASFAVRFLRTVGLAVVFIPLGFAMATVPIAPAINEMLTPPSDAESLQLFEPYDAQSAEIDAHIMGHPVAEALRANPAFRESRPFMKLPASVQAHHLTSGALGGPGRLWVPPLTFVEEGGRSIVVLLYLGDDLCGHPGIVHGGMLATLLDEGLARCCFQALPNKVGMTASLTVDYKAPTPAGSFVVLRGETTKVDGRKAWVKGSIEQMDPPEGKEPVVFATAHGLFVEPRQAATMARLYPAASG